MYDLQKSIKEIKKCKKKIFSNVSFTMKNSKKRKNRKKRKR